MHCLKFDGRTDVKFEIIDSDVIKRGDGNIKHAMFLSCVVDSNVSILW